MAHLVYAQEGLAANFTAPSLPDYYDRLSDVFTTRPSLSEVPSARFRFALSPTLTPSSGPAQDFFWAPFRAP